MRNYYHAIVKDFDFNLEVLESILSEGIKPVLFGSLANELECRMNYDDEVCMFVRKEKTSIKNFLYTSACKPIISQGFITLKINGNLEGVFKPPLVNHYRAVIMSTEGSRGFTEFKDEYRYKGIIKPTEIESVLFPATGLMNSRFTYFSHFGEIDSKTNSRLERIIPYYEKVEDVVRSSGLNIPIEDLSTEREIESSDKIYQFKKHLF